MLSVSLGEQDNLALRLARYDVASGQLTAETKLADFRDVWQGRSSGDNRIQFYLHCALSRAIGAFQSSLVKATAHH